MRHVRIYARNFWHCPCRDRNAGADGSYEDAHRDRLSECAAPLVVDLIKAGKDANIVEGAHDGLCESSRRMGVNVIDLLDAAGQTSCYLECRVESERCWTPGAQKLKLI